MCVCVCVCVCVQFGVLLADKKPGPFLFEVQYLRALLELDDKNFLALPGSSKSPKRVRTHTYGAIHWACFTLTP